MIRVLIIVSALVLSCLANTSFAHQQKEAYINILFNQRSGNMEVSHRFLLHDAEHGLSLVIDGAGDLNTDASTQEKFVEYVQQHFKISDASHKPIKLEPVGYEAQGKYFWIYQESAIPETPELKLKHSALHELWPSQTNHINVEKGGWVKSVRLQKENGVRWQTISLDKP